MQIEGGTVNRPPYFNGNNYAYWKNKMRIFIDSMDFDLWSIVEEGYKLPTIINDEGETKVKPRSTWTREEKQRYTLNSKAMNALYCALGPEEYNRISILKTAKEIWETLEITYEGNNQVKDSKISTLVHKYEMFKMKQGETIIQMFTRLTDIINALSSLGRETPTVEIVRKVLQGLPKEWRPKVTAIEEAKDLRKMTIDTLIGSLVTHEIVLKAEEEEEEEATKPKKGIALQASTKEEEGDDDDEEMALLTNRFQRLVRRSREGRRGDSKFTNKGEERKCFNYNKIGHIAANCRIKQKGKKALATWDDNESDFSDSEVSDFGFIASIDDLEDFDNADDDLDNIDIQDAYDELYNESKKFAQKNIALKKKIVVLETEVTTLKRGIMSLETSLKQKVDELERFVGGSKNLSTLMGKQVNFGNRSGIGFIASARSNALSKNTLSKETLSDYFVPGKSLSNARCYYCSTLGHIRTNCPKRKANRSGPKWQWVPKVRCLFAGIMGLQAKTHDAMWYLDSGCSRHMTGEKERFTSLSQHKSGTVTFGDDSKGEIIGKGIIGNPNSSCIKDVYLVDGLKHSLLSISQLCDKGNRVIFDTHYCAVQDKTTDEVIFTGRRANNTYIVNMSDITKDNVKCLASFESESWLWHRRLGHANMKLLKLLSQKDLVKGIPKLNFSKDRVCEACQLGKQIKRSFKPINVVSTTKPLELIHMDLVGPIRTTSIGGKKYFLTMVDDYSRYTWVSFITHKNEAFNMFVKIVIRIQKEQG
jgi:hypothetical protein